MILRAAHVSELVVYCLISSVWSPRVFILICFISSVLRPAREMPPPSSLPLCSHELHSVVWVSVYVLFQQGVVGLAKLGNSSFTLPEVFYFAHSLPSLCMPGSTFPIQGHRPRSRYILALQSVAMGQLCLPRHSSTIILARSSPAQPESGRHQFGS